MSVSDVLLLMAAFCRTVWGGSSFLERLSDSRSLVLFPELCPEKKAAANALLLLFLGHVSEWGILAMSDLIFNLVRNAPRGLPAKAETRSHRRRRLPC